MAFHSICKNVYFQYKIMNMYYYSIFKNKGINGKEKYNKGHISKMLHRVTGKEETYSD